MCAVTGLQVLELLATKGVKLSFGAEGLSVVRHAAINGHVAVLELLAAKGVKLSMEARTGLTAVDYAARTGHVAVLELLIDPDDGNWRSSGTNHAGASPWGEQ